MGVYGELDPMVEHRTQFAFKDKRKNIAKVNIPNIAYPCQHIDIDILLGSRDHVIISGTVKITFNLNIESTDKARSVVNNVGRALVKKKVLIDIFKYPVYPYDLKEDLIVRLELNSSKRVILCTGDTTAT